METILPHLPTHSSVLDPFCGDGAILDVCKSKGSKTHGIELDPTRAKQASKKHKISKGDAFETHWPKADLILANPPFSRGLDFVQKALSDFPGTPLAVLLPLPFLGSKGRAQFHKDHPCSVYVLSKRPSFSGSNKTDNVPYAWFVWNVGTPGTWRIL